MHLSVNLPFLTGQTFRMSVRVGEADWKNMSGSVHVPTFQDCRDAAQYFATMERVLKASHKLLKDEGALFVHVDYRAHARLRILADEIFGEENFVNEIIWAYKSGGRARASFPRKHDIILLYRKTRKQYFNIGAVLEAACASGQPYAQTRGSRRACVSLHPFRGPGVYLLR